MFRNFRKKFGLLEKHKDYVERAKAYHKKEDTLRVMFEMPLPRNLHNIQLFIEFCRRVLDLVVLYFLC